MSFNSFEFLIFLPVVFVLYWFVFNKNLKTQNGLLLLASYIFYGWWDWRFLFLLIFSTALDFYTGLRIADAKTERIKKIWLYSSITINLGFLGFFKYYNFFIENWVLAFKSIGYTMNPWTLSIVLPIGISFYTFHGLSYVIDISKGRIEPSKSWVNYCVFVSYFPLLVAGPIERATHLLPQIERPRKFRYSQGIDGLRLIIWGMFKKVVLADTLATAVNDIFANYKNYSGYTLILGGIYFAFQIYGDFSGYSDIARGVSKCFGIELLLNFDRPFSSKTVTEFWRRWHISLSTWFFDYVFNPIVISLRNWGRNATVIFGLMFTFFLTGLWHGAGWKFVVYGLLNGIAVVYEYVAKKQRVKLFSYLPKFVNENLSKVITIGYMCVCWVFFRSRDLASSIGYLKRCFYFHGGVDFKQQFSVIVIYLVLSIILFFKYDSKWYKYFRIALYYPMLWFVLENMFKPTEFIYFQF